MSSENIPMVEKPSTPIDDEPKGSTSSINLDGGEPQQEDRASTDEGPKYPRLFDPYENQPENPDGNPFAHLFKVLADKDTAQCKAWEDEVQNILIFAALFSAVVTAFIIESYQRLQPDPNDVMVNLLAHIAQRMDGVPVNGTPSVSTILSGNNFVPTQADIRINVAWFISLVLSLTAALIGIVTLQWLREHRQYPSWTPKDKLGILNMRMESLEKWYVPQIFASLPLFVQGSLIFFFAGIIEFLFGLDAKVAIPVTLCICIPLTFLLVTTMFPLLQLYFLLSPFGLPFRTGVPSPCPYKSPQSIIVRSIGTILAWFVSECDKYSTVARYRPPAVNNILSSGDWAGMDRKWLEARANYASLPNLPPQQQAYKLSDHLQTVDYDAVLVFRRVMDLDLAETDTAALFYCMTAVYYKLAQDMPNLKLWGINERGVEDRFVSSILSLIPCSYDSDPDMDDNKVFIQHIVTNIKGRSEGNILISALLLIISLRSTPNFFSLCHEMTSRMLLKALASAPDELFKLEDIRTWFPLGLWKSLSSLGRFPNPIILKHATSLFHDFLKRCTQPDPVTTLRPDAENYDVAQMFTSAVVRNQSVEDINLTLVYLKTLCNNTTPQERPILFLAACFYMDKVSFWHTDPDKGLRPALKPARDELSDLLCLPCNVTERSFDWMGCWKGLDEAVKGIYDAYNNTPEGQEPPQIEPDTPEMQSEANPDIKFNPDASSKV